MAVKTRPPMVQKEVAEETQDKPLVSTHRSAQQKEVNTIDITGVIASRSEYRSRSNSSAGAISVIYSNRNGKRGELSQSVTNHLEDPSHVQVGFLHDKLMIAKELPGGGTHYCLKKSGAKRVIYSAGLVEEIIHFFSLDFSERVCITLGNASFEYDQDMNPIVLIGLEADGAEEADETTNEVADEGLQYDGQYIEDSEVEQEESDEPDVSEESEEAADEA